MMTAQRTAPALFRSGLMLVAVLALLLHQAQRAGVAAGADGTDFIPLWTGAAMAVEGFGAAIWDPAVFAAFQESALGRSWPNLPWLYPPTAPLLFWPIGLMPLPAAQLIWSIAGVAAWLAACRLAFSRGGITAPFAVAGAALAPAVMLNLGMGQNGIFFGAILIAGLAWVPVRPVAAGLLLSLLAAKPQFAILVPVALAAGGHWRAFGSAAVGCIALIAAATACFGVAAWTGFVDGLTQQGLRTAGPALYLLMQPTWRAAAAQVDAPEMLRMAAAILPPVLAALALASARPAMRTARGLVVLVPIATVAGGLYFLHYDLTAWAAALLMLWPLLTGRPEQVVWWIGWLMPAAIVLAQLTLPGAGAIVSAAVLWIAVRRLRRDHCPHPDNGP